MAEEIIQSKLSEGDVIKIKLDDKEEDEIKIEIAKPKKGKPIEKSDSKENDPE